MGDYKKLRVWLEACKFADRVEQMARQLPQPERQWAFEQLVRAAHAIHENIAEGWGYDSDPQRLKYCRQALSTANESEDQLLALDRKTLLTGQFASLTAEARSVCAMLAKLKQRLEESVAKSRAPGRWPAQSRRPTTAAVRLRPAAGPGSHAPSDEPADPREPTTALTGRSDATSRPLAADSLRPAPGPEGHAPSDELRRLKADS